MDPCPFCHITRGRLGATDLRLLGDDIWSFQPLNPVTQGHRLVVPSLHVPDAVAEPWLTGKVMEKAARLAAEVGSSNIISSVGVEATQTVFHLHVHVVPRRAGDGLRLPWSL